jgi:hypothetical protein
MAWISAVRRTRPASTPKHLRQSPTSGAPRSHDLKSRRWSEAPLDQSITRREARVAEQIREPRRVDVAYSNNHWLAEVAPDYDEPLDCDSLQRVIDTVQRDWPDQPLIFIVDQSTIEGDVQAEAQLRDATEKSGAMVISSVQEF